jgi:hypothetical protein
VPGLELRSDGCVPLPEVLPADLEELVRYGLILDRRPASLSGDSVAMRLATSWLRVRTRDGKLAPLRANRVQMAFEQRRGKRNIVLKARQMGLTTWIAARFFLRTITQPGTLTLQVAHTREAAEEIFEIVRRFAENLPEELRRGPLKTLRTNARELVFGMGDSKYTVVSAGERNAGRGLTTQNLHCSEVARWPGHAAETLAGLRAALAPEGELVLESTPDGVGGCFHDEWQRAEETGTVRHFFPWWMEERYRAAAVDATTLSEDEQRLMQREGLDLAQIGYRRMVQANFRGLARQEYAEDAATCFRTSGDCVFELEPIEARMVELLPPIETRRNGEMRIWLPSLKGKRYVVAVDPAGGGSEGDFSAAQVLELGTGLQCAEFAGHLGGLDLARLVTELAREYNDAELVVERNNQGDGVLALAAITCGYMRLYEQDGKRGWLTDSVSRPAVLARLGAALVQRPECFASERLLRECRSFVRLPNGGTGARAGTHDDCVMAMAIALAAREELLLRRA